MLRLSPVEIAGPAGMLEGMLHHDPEGPPATLAVVCHPHPLYGGTMHNKVVFRTAEALSELGLAVLRFNFRGVNLSHGEHDGGRGEQDDLRAAMDFLGDRFGMLPLLLAGFSFGAAVTLRVAPSDRGVGAMLAVAPPVQGYDYPDLPASVKPKAVVQGTADTVCPAELLAGEFERWGEPRRLWRVPGATHFFDRQLGELKLAVREAATWALEISRKD